MRLKSVWWIGMLAAGLALGSGCSASEKVEPPLASPEETPQASPVETPQEALPEAVITMEDGSVIHLELYPAIAPNTVNNFIALAEEGFYDGTIFHRIIENFMVQGGDPTGTGMGGPGYMIPGEFSKNGHDNALSHMPGVLSMARAQPFDTAGSQFFIVHGDASFLDGSYAAFGMVRSGMDVVHALAQVETGHQDRPLEPPVMRSIVIHRNGYDFEEVVKTP